nr:MAG TPA: hypothetical protein [Caudoviricetes sp.]
MGSAVSGTGGRTVSQALCPITSHDWIGTA